MDTRSPPPHLTHLLSDYSSDPPPPRPRPKLGPCPLPSPPSFPLHTFPQNPRPCPLQTHQDPSPSSAATSVGSVVATAGEADPFVAVEPATMAAAAAPEVSHLEWGHWYTLQELKAMTKTFSNKNVIREGGYGIVYHDVLEDKTQITEKIAQ